MVLCYSLRMTGASQRTAGIAKILAEAAAVHHPEVAHRKVESCGIEWVELTKRGGHVDRHAPAWAGIARQAETAANADDVCVQRHDQLARAHLRPHTEIDLIVAHHPAQK